MYNLNQPQVSAAILSERNCLSMLSWLFGVWLHVWLQLSICV